MAGGHPHSTYALKCGKSSTPSPPVRKRTQMAIPPLVSTYFFHSPPSHAPGFEKNQIQIVQFGLIFLIENSMLYTKLYLFPQMISIRSVKLDKNTSLSFHFQNTRKSNVQFLSFHFQNIRKLNVQFESRFRGMNSEKENIFDCRLALLHHVNTSIEQFELRTFMQFQKQTKIDRKNIAGFSSNLLA